jgi:hypothetical protein
VAAAKRNLRAYEDSEVDGLLFGAGEGALLSELKKFLDDYKDSEQPQPKPPAASCSTRGGSSGGNSGAATSAAWLRRQAALTGAGPSDAQVVAATAAAASDAAFQRTKLECLYRRANPTKLAEVRAQREVELARLSCFKRV